MILRKQTFEFSEERLQRLLAQAEARFRNAFEEALRIVRDSQALSVVEDLLRQNRVDEALFAAEVAATRLATAWAQVYVLAGGAVVDFIGDSFRVTAAFDVVNARAVQELQQNEFRLIREFVDEQRNAVRTALVAGTERGLNPRQQALLFRESLGLTQFQTRAVENFRRLLEEGSAEALTRELRDRRFDPTVLGAIRGDRTLSRDQINRMVERYRERYVAFRGETISRTEALSAVHAGSDEGFRQAIENGTLDAQELEQRWSTSQDERVRGSHRFMHGQSRPIGESFLSGRGNLLRYPGDPAAPAEDSIKCRCAKTTRFRGPEEE